MPGQLKPDAICPICRRPLDALADESRADFVTRTFYHEPQNGREFRPCSRVYSDLAEADRVRRSLEVPQ